MPNYPYTITNGAGEQITWTGIVRDPRGERIVGKGIAQPKAGPPMHVHYLEEEGFTVDSGRIGYQTTGAEPKYAGPGESVVFAPGVGHRWWNAGDTELRFTGYASPPNNHEYILTAIFESMKRNGGRQPSAFDMAFLLSRYRSEMGSLAVPVLVQKLLFPILLAIGKATGKYAHFADAPPPVVRPAAH